ncbi:MAG: hypothetical protein HY722_12320 [Planctomycetes bacterium]|nr:hypothetical protein [Planctomycetota bacterium]
MSRTKKKTLPGFKSEAEEAEFWSVHSPEDYPDEFEPVDEEVRLAASVAGRIDEKARKDMVTIRLERRMIRWAKALAKKEGKPYQVLLREILQRRVDGYRLAHSMSGEEGNGEIRILRVPREEGYQYVLTPRDRVRLQKVLVGADVTVPESCFARYDTHHDFRTMIGVRFEAEVPGVFHVTEALMTAMGTRCVVVDAPSGKTLWRSDRRHGGGTRAPPVRASRRAGLGLPRDP